MRAERVGKESKCKERKGERSSCCVITLLVLLTLQLAAVVFILFSIERERVWTFFPFISIAKSYKFLCGS